MFAIKYRRVEVVPVTTSTLVVIELAFAACVPSTIFSQYLLLPSFFVLLFQLPKVTAAALYFIVCQKPFSSEGDDLN
jgi:hypothetical protein